MDAGKAVVIGLVVGGGYLAWRLAQQNGNAVYAPIDLDFSGLDLGGLAYGYPDPGGSGGAGVDSQPGGYYSALSLAENPPNKKTGVQDPYAKNPYSSASGLFQFTKGTWTALGGDWGPDPNRAFGGLTPSPAEQLAMAEKLTAGNATMLGRADLAVNNLTLYAAHIFGPKAPKILKANPSTPLSALVGASTVAKNPALGTSVSSFIDYLVRKVGNG